mmetsp:Transcript_13310/g.28264  ORF Transcript_13310/g.28264 Transcript_13310/m.28264 type:complete len:549 (+) Transcript_13310:520-2166(+)
MVAGVRVGCAGHRAVRVAVPVGVRVPRNDVALVVHLKLHRLLDAQRADQHQRHPHHPLPPLRDELHVDGHLVPQQQEHQPEQNLAGVVAASPEPPQHCGLRPRSADGERCQRCQVVWPGQRVQHASQDPRARALQHLQRPAGGGVGGGGGELAGDGEQRGARLVSDARPRGAEDGHQRAPHQQHVALGEVGQQQPHGVERHQQGGPLVQQHSQPQRDAPQQRRRARPHHGEGGEDEVLHDDAVGAVCHLEDVRQHGDPRLPRVQQQHVRHARRRLRRRLHDRHPHVRARQRRRVVDPVPNHHHPLAVPRALLARLGDEAHLVLGQEAALDLVEVEAHRGRHLLGALLVVAGENHHAQALRVGQLRHRLAAPLLHVVVEPEQLHLRHRRRVLGVDGNEGGDEGGLVRRLGVHAVPQALHQRRVVLAQQLRGEPHPPEAHLEGACALCGGGALQPAAEVRLEVLHPHCLHLMLLPALHNRLRDGVHGEALHGGGEGERILVIMRSVRVSRLRVQRLDGHALHHARGDGARLVQRNGAAGGDFLEGEAAAD